MAAVKFLKIEVTKNAMAKVTKLFPYWEAQVVAAIWGDNAQVVGEETREFKVPEARDEFQRLADKYGPKDEQIPAVAQVYGNFGPGITALRNEIDKSVTDGATRPEEAGPLPQAAVAGFDRDAFAGNTIDGKPVEEVVREEGEPVAAGGVPVSELGLDEGGDPDDYADLTGEDGARAERVVL